MSSHREAPEISKDPVADNTDVYAFVSPDKPNTVTLIADFIPLQEPAGGPTFYQFGDDVLYEILIDNNGDGVEEITYQFSFTTVFTNRNTFLYNTGPITSLTDPAWNIRQYYTVTKITAPNSRINNGAAQTGPLGQNLPCPPANIGPRSTPNYPALADAAVTTLASGEVVYAGPRADPFYVDLGSIFDLGALRPFQNFHFIPLPAAPGVNGLAGYNIHTIALQVPAAMLLAPAISGRGGNQNPPLSTIGVWARASRQAATVLDSTNDGGTVQHSGPWRQVSRLANPLINEVIINVGDKDRWNTRQPSTDVQFVDRYQHPELALLLPKLYPSLFPNLAALNASGAPRADLVAILLTGIPAGKIPGFQNFTGSTLADLVRLNVSIPPAANPNRLGLLGNDLAGFPNGRRVFDNVVAIELRAIAGATYNLINPSYTPDAAATQLTDGTTNDAPYLNVFPYLGYAYQGFASEHDADNDT